MKDNKVTGLGILFIITGVVLLAQAIIPIRVLTYHLPEGNCSFNYPSNWSVETTKEVLEFPQGTFGQHETKGVRIITVDFYDPESTISIRFVFMPLSEPFDLLSVATSMGSFNELIMPEYRLWEIGEVGINGFSAVRRIESYRVDDNKGSAIRSLVVTYFQGSRGLYSFQLIDPSWPDLEEEMVTYEHLLNTFMIMD